MHKNNFYISFGVWLVIIPLLGVPIVWRDSLVFLSGAFLILVSIGPIFLRKIQPKSIRRLTEKKKPELPKTELKFSDNENNSPPAPLL